MPIKSFPAKRKPPDLRRNGSLSLSRPCTNIKADLTNGRRETKEDEGRKGSLSLSLSNLWTNPRKEEPSRID
jgi:hypothetical protein